MPNSSSKTLATGAKQLVVHDALDIISSVFGSYSLSFTPTTIILTSALPGAVNNTFFAPALRCFDKPSLSLKAPVESITRSTPNSFHGNSSGFLLFTTVISLSPILILSSANTSTSFSNVR